jgi:NAD(P)-dependent dehydrogenase (short-subunit alcohol dehydrogenase family)
LQVPIGLYKYAASTLKPHGITVNAYAPGMFTQIVLITLLILPFTKIQALSTHRCVRSLLAH